MPTSPCALGTLKHGLPLFKVGQYGFGVFDRFRFLPNGEVERRLAVLELRRNGFAVLDAAPRDFRQVGF